MPIHKATIMPRWNALGMVTMLPDNDQTSQSYKEMMAYMDIFMGGRVAEELIFGKENVISGMVGIVYHGGNNGEESGIVVMKHVR
jgi:ATP-dependent Zn protease